MPCALLNRDTLQASALVMQYRRQGDTVPVHAADVNKRPYLKHLPEGAGVEELRDVEKETASVFVATLWDVLHHGLVLEQGCGAEEVDSRQTVSLRTIFQMMESSAQEMAFPRTSEVDFVSEGSAMVVSLEALDANYCRHH